MSSKTKWRLAFYTFLVPWLVIFMGIQNLDLGWGSGGRPQRSMQQSLVIGAIWLLPLCLYILWEFLASFESPPREEDRPEEK